MKLLYDGYDMCLAISEKRLSKSSFQSSVELRTKMCGQDILLEGSLTGLEVHILKQGQSLIELNSTIMGNLAVGGREFKVDGTICTITTPFLIRQVGDNYQVVPDFSHELFRINVKNAKLSPDVCALVENLLSRKGVLREEKYILLEVNSAIQKIHNMDFKTVVVTSSYAAYAPSLSSLIVLMAREKKDGLPDIDPHIMPNGESAVARISGQLVQDTNGSYIMNAISAAYQFRPKPMNACIADVDDAMRGYTEGLVRNVQVGESALNFYGIQALNGEILLSATEMGVDELNLFTAIDPTDKGNNPVQEQTAKLFNDCLMYYMNPLYRKHLANYQQPKLPQEVLDVTAPYKDWYAKLARLQLAKQIRDAKDGTKYIKVGKEDLDNMLDKMAKSNEYRIQINVLYGLSYCVVHPRFSLYLEEKERWKEEYAAYLQSDEHIQEIMSHEDSVILIHEDEAKLSVFDASGELYREVHEKNSKRILELFAQEHWRETIREYPDEYKEALTQILERYVSEENDNEDEKEERENITAIIESCGETLSLVESIMTTLTCTAVNEGYLRIQDALSAESVQAAIEAGEQELGCIERLWHEHPDFMKNGSQALALVASLAVIVTFAINVKSMREKIDKTTGMEKVHSIAELVVSILDFIWASGMTIYLVGTFVGEILVYFSVNITPAVVTFAQTVATGFESILLGASVVLAFLGAGMSIFSAVCDFSKGDVTSGVLDVLMACVSILTGLGIVFSWNGIVLIVLAAAGLILGIIQIILQATSSDANEQEKAVEQLNVEVINDNKVYKEELV